MFINNGAKIRFFQKNQFRFQINYFVLLRLETLKKIINRSVQSPASITNNHSQ